MVRGLISSLPLLRIGACALALSGQSLPVLANQDDCHAVDFFEIDVPSSSSRPKVGAVLSAYPELSFERSTEIFVGSDGKTFALTAKSELSEDEVLNAATFEDQFRYLYPLEFELESRLSPWVDPGRLRDPDFFTFLYFDTEAEARETLTTVHSQAHGVGFQVTEKHGVACQLAAALSLVGSDHAQFFLNLGGSFNWRLVSGTQRLSVHSYGAAIDLNSRLGGYWRWSGVSAGEAGEFNNTFSVQLVQAFERFGFIWGGKWHHFDGMHFEYRPELILYARLMRDLHTGE